MGSYVDEKRAPKRPADSYSPQHQPAYGLASFQLAARQPQALGELRQLADNSPRAMQLRSLQAPAGPNTTGLPDQLKAGVEALSGVSLDDVKVHYNSAQPAQLNALAYAQGSDIHVGPGQEHHLPHEAWHIVQQAQGRVRATMQMKDGVPVNADAGLEHEADVMGARALALPAQSVGWRNGAGSGQLRPSQPTAANSEVQRIRIRLDHANDGIMLNVRAAKVPKAGDKEVDGLRGYNEAHPPIADDENIVLEGHGTYLTRDHARDAPYDSQAQLGPRQLANVARLVPKGPHWHGQIVLFGCATGTLTMDVSRYYLALTGKSVNVVGTLADIRMEVPSMGDPNKAKREHRAEYDKQGNAYPKAAAESVSARTAYRRWLLSTRDVALKAVEKIQMATELHAFEGDKDEGANLDTALGETLQGFQDARATRIHYQGGAFGERDVAQAREMIQVACSELETFRARLAEEHDNLGDTAVSMMMFFVQLAKDFEVFDRQAEADGSGVAELGIVDWEGDNVTVSRAREARGLPREALPRDQLDSADWGGGGGQMQTHAPIQHNESS